MPCSATRLEKMSSAVDIAPYRAAFETGRAALPALAAQREAALARFQTLGLPTRRDEAWRFTNLRKLQGQSFVPAAEGPHPVPRLDRWRYASETHRFVLVNGRFAPELSRIGDLPKGALLAAAAPALARDSALAASLIDATDRDGGQAFASLNAALFADGFVLKLDRGVKLDRPVEILHWGEAAHHSFHPRSLILLEAEAEATVIESFAGSGAYWTNAVTAIQLHDGAALRHVKIQDEDRSAIHLAQVRAHLDARARYHSFVLTLGAGLSRHETAVEFAQAGAECRLDGAYLLRGEQDATNATFVDHAAPNCATGEVFKGVVDDRAHGAFLGRIAVRPEAQKTEAHQLNKNLLLSPRAAVDTKPELEILADDVKCSHGATVGDLDEAALFYLEARGIPASEARQMLIAAFAADALGRIEDAALRNHLAAQVERWLGARKD